MERRGESGPRSFKKGTGRGQSPVPVGSGTMELSELLGVDISTIDIKGDTGGGVSVYDGGVSVYGGGAISGSGSGGNSGGGGSGGSGTGGLTGQTGNDNKSEVREKEEDRGLDKEKEKGKEKESEKEKGGNKQMIEILQAQRDRYKDRLATVSSSSSSNSY